MKKQIISGLLIVMALSVSISLTVKAQNSNNQNIQVKTDPVEIGKRITDHVAKKKSYRFYAMVCTYYGSLIFGDATDDSEITRQMEKGIEPYVNGKRNYRKGHVDYNVFGIWPFELYRQTGNEKYLQIGKELADHEYKNVRKDGLTSYSRFWVDDMYMVGSLQVQAFKSTKEQKYLDRAASLLKIYCDSLQRENGLFYHRKDAPFFWGRGNGWAAASLTEVLLVLPKTHEHYLPLLKAYQKMMSTLKNYQEKDGMWHQLIDYPESYAETSSSGMFLYAMASGIDSGWLPFDEYKDNVTKGWDALAGYVNKKGKTKNVCIATNAKNSEKHYLKRWKLTGDYHGQAAVLWAATAMVKLLDNYN
ncbi:glycoside hydrolase family 88/105 protein [Maribellus maritimus]|uniref:glycoside hydrolase family 88/105 protein n=1 Tax=Maribellus maritimus TaxID=2870838 RepID=UPI001EEAF73A|nr:glycoside hydrolase family 88 protein [Maribellus maritimus]MCG6188609.1 glycoside hydrolase family 88 protein [Maribellus maritimus]